MLVFRVCLFAYRCCSFSPRRFHIHIPCGRCLDKKKKGVHTRKNPHVNVEVHFFFFFFSFLYVGSIIIPSHTFLLEKVPFCSLLYSAGYDEPRMLAFIRTLQATSLESSYLGTLLLSYPCSIYHVPLSG